MTGGFAAATIVQGRYEAARIQPRSGVWMSALGAQVPSQTRSYAGFR